MMEAMQEEQETAPTGGNNNKSNKKQMVPPGRSNSSSSSSSSLSPPPIDNIDSEDIVPPPQQPQQSEEQQQSILRQVFNRILNPNQCWQPAMDSVQHGCTTVYKQVVASDREEFEWMLPGLLQDIHSPNPKSRMVALQKLYRLVDREHQENRVPAVCSTKFATVETLVTCLEESNRSTQGSSSSVERRQALLILNNLCIPSENKAAILFGAQYDIFLSALLRVIQSRVAESYLAVICLVNLSYLDDIHAKVRILNFVPLSNDEESDPTRDAPSQYHHQQPTDHPDGLLRTLESVIQSSELYMEAHPELRHNSVEQQCCRWSMNVVRNLATVHENAIVICQKTELAMLAARCLSEYGVDASQMQLWTLRESLEDAALMLIVHLCNNDDCYNRILQHQTSWLETVTQICNQLERNGRGIHRKRARALLQRFENVTSNRSVGYSV